MLLNNPFGTYEPPNPHKGTSIRSSRITYSKTKFPFEERRDFYERLLLNVSGLSRKICINRKHSSRTKTLTDSIATNNQHKPQNLILKIAQWNCCSLSQEKLDYIRSHDPSSFTPRSVEAKGIYNTTTFHEFFFQTKSK